MSTRSRLFATLMANHSPRAAAGCPGEPAAALGIEHIVISRITTPPGAAGQGFDLQLTLIDTAVGGIALELQQSCAQCDGERAAAKLTTMLAELWQKGSGRARGVLAVSSTPPGAELAVDEHVVGTTPYRHPVWAGQHALLLRQPGYAEERTSTNVDSGQTADVSVTLQPVEPPPAVSVAAVAPAPAALPRPARL